MGRQLKDALAKGKRVRDFGVGQLCHPKIVEIIGQHDGRFATMAMPEYMDR